MKLNLEDHIDSFSANTTSKPVSKMKRGREWEGDNKTSSLLK